MNASQYAKENGLELSEVFAKFGLTHHKQNVPEEQKEDTMENEAVEAVEKVEEKPIEKVKKETEHVLFYWKEGKNATFSCNGKLLKSQRSSIRLDRKKQAAEIEFLRKHKTNEANGGNEFCEMDIKNGTSSLGDSIDELMLLSVETLANMVGGKVADFAKSKGVLIGEILDLKG